MDPQTSIENLLGIGKYYSQKLKRLEVETFEDLIYHFPFRYEDFSKITTIAKITPGEKLSVQGIVWQIKNIKTSSGKLLTIATVVDQSDAAEVVWFNQPYLPKIIKPGMAISLAGKAEVKGRRIKLISPSYEIIRQNLAANTQTSSSLHTGRLVPIYPETEGLTSKWLRTKIGQFLPQYLKIQKDFLPSEIIKRQKLVNLTQALSKIHFPKNYQEVTEAKKRLSFDELFLIQFLALLRKKNWQEKGRGIGMKIDPTKIEEFIQNLPFKLTNAQLKAIGEILADMQRETPTNRLLEGDVGSGKTVVAAAAAYVTHLNGFDVLMAAPTEILTFQHQKTLTQILSPYGIKVGIWTGSKKRAGDVTCGTHALLNTFKPKKQVGLVVVDEQHRFGVAQRAKLFLDQSQKFTPHLLTMTATPIPRTLALTLYGDLDLSILDQMPQGRQKIATFVVPNFKRTAAYKFIEKQVRLGRQAFIITPFVEPSETMATVRAAAKEFKRLQKIFSKKVKLGLLHGRLKSKEKEEQINKFKENKINILVTTPVVEVGIDVPNATIMMVESAERFGLAQLHQLRGRVGRGEYKSYCLLFSSSASQNAYKRLKSMEKIHLGFQLAEIDLQMRGPGEIFGLKQSGFINLKIADLSDHQTIAKAQSEARKLIEEDEKLKNYPLLAQKLNRLQSELSQPN